MQTDGPPPNGRPAPKPSSVGYIVCQVMLAMALVGMLSTDASRYSSGADESVAEDRSVDRRRSDGWTAEDGSAAFLAEVRKSEEERLQGGIVGADELAFVDDADDATYPEADVNVDDVERSTTAGGEDEMSQASASRSSALANELSSTTSSTPSPDSDQSSTVVDRSTTSVPPEPTPTSGAAPTTATPTSTSGPTSEPTSTTGGSEKFYAPRKPSTDTSRSTDASVPTDTSASTDLPSPVPPSSTETVRNSDRPKRQGKGTGRTKKASRLGPKQPQTTRPTSRVPSAVTPGPPSSTKTKPSPSSTTPPSVTRPSPTSSPYPTTPAPSTSLSSSTAAPTSVPTTNPHPTTVPATVPVSTTNPHPSTHPTTTSTQTTSPPATSTTSTHPTTSTSSSTDPGGSSTYDSIRNTDPKFRQFASTRSEDLPVDALTFGVSQYDNGTVGDGQFRVACQYSHFAEDDPIVYPGQPGAAHLHMFFGNTGIHAGSTTDSIVNSGGGTCNGFELNRSGYWTPALLDGRGNTVVPDTIIVYYKTKWPNIVQRMPQGLKMVSGNASHEAFTASQDLNWSCGDNGFAYNKTNRIPDCGGDTINASIAFPQCWDGVNLDADDHRSHMRLVSISSPCPSSHPVRLPQISVLLYYPGQGSVDGWYLSSDRHGGHSALPGTNLHADWWGGWHDNTMDRWIDGCMKAARNCSLGQTGTDRQLAKISNLQTYDGPNVLPLP